MKENFRGWTSVYSFTFRQATRKAGFKAVTILISLIIIGSIIAVTIFHAKPEEKQSDSAQDVSSVKTVYILDQSGLQPTSFQELNPELAKAPYKHIKYVTVTDQSREEVIKTASKDSSYSFAVIITVTDGGYQLEAAIPDNSSITRGEAEALLSQMQTAFESSKLLQSGLDTKQLTTVMTPNVTSSSDLGDKAESDNGIAYVIRLIAPMLFSLIMYLMLLLYGSTVSKSISTEKTSKLMETLLTSIHPYALITGKILAVSSMAVLQFVTWILSAFIGLYGGNAVAHSIYPEYHNSVITILNLVKDSLGKTALSPAAILLAVIIFGIGLLFYFVLAGLAGCMVSKPEEAASTQQLFIMPILISFLLTYMAPIYHNEALVQATRYIPFTIPFGVPSDLITGTIGLGEGLLSLASLAVFTFLLVLLSGRIYKGLILYNGQKVSLKMIGNVLKNKQ